MSEAFEITIHNRSTNSKETEKVYGHKAVEFSYNSFIGKYLAPIVASKTLSKLYGSLQSTSFSKKKVAPFIKAFSIPIHEYEKGSLTESPIEESYLTFNEFFIRKFKKGKRLFVSDQSKMAAFAEARYFAYEEITDLLSIPVKGSMLKAKDLIGDDSYSAFFDGGPLFIARLCPVDYHRYHYPDNGTTLKSHKIPGDLHSVNPIALKFRKDIFIKNERRVSILETENFGKLAYIEVGATCVGKIVQTSNEETPFKRGDEKGYFLFGGSTVIVCGEKGKWTPCLDIIYNTKQGVETYIQLGDEVANRHE